MAETETQLDLGDPVRVAALIRDAAHRLSQVVWEGESSPRVATALSNGAYPFREDLAVAVREMLVWAEAVRMA